MSTPKLTTAYSLLQRIKSTVAHELHDYPYPIAGCDEVFKTLVLQKECCRIALSGLMGVDGLDKQDAVVALHDLLATPVALTVDEWTALAELVRPALADA